MERVRVGIVGCGEATQIMHLPALAFLADRFEVTALADVSPHVLAGVGDRWGVAARTTDAGELVVREDVDAVLVATPDAFHAEAVLAALAAGKHVLVEKPMCMAIREADEIEAARIESDRIVQVGYVRRYAPAVREALELVRGTDVRFARVHDLLGLNPLVVEQTARVVRGDDLSGTSGPRDRLVAEAIGDAPRDVADGYRLLLSLGCHDVSLMRELLGVPQGVLYAAAWHDAWYVTGAFDYGSFACQFEIGFDSIPRVDTHVEVYGAERVVRLTFDTPFVRNLPVRLVVTEANGEGGFVERTVQPSLADPFVCEWEAFHRSVATGEQPKCSPSDFRLDLELFAEMAQAMTRAH